VLIETDTILGSNPQPSAYLEAYRVLRSSLMAMKDENTFGSVLITSPGEKEGKTTVSINLATALALVHRSTILVDADFYGTGLEAALSLAEDTPGLTDVCAGQAELDGVLLQTELEQLRVLPAGTDVARGPDLALTDAMRDTIEQLKQRAEYVLIDCTPVEGFSTAISLAHSVDMVLLVTLARSRVVPVRRVIEELREVGATVGGVVVNDILHADSTVYQAYHRYYQ
jgi:capsular exopolysaccharide synthesis family protein